MREQKFERALGDLKDMKIGLFLSNHQFVEGVLLAVKQDHLVFDVNQYVFYIARQHIQAFSKNAKDFCISSRIVPYLDRLCLTDILNVMKYSWVTINSSGKQTLFGVLSKISEDHITLINDAELLYIPKSYILTIYSEMSNDQIIKANHMELLASQKTHPATISKEIDEIEIHQPENIQDAVLQLDHETKLPELTLEKETQIIRGEEGKEEPQVVGNGSHDQTEILQQLEMVGKLDLSNKDEKDELQAGSRQKKTHQNIVPHSNDETKELSRIVMENRLDIQAEKQIIEVIDLESIRMEESLVKLETESSGYSVLEKQDSLELIVQDAEYSSEEVDQEELESIFNNRKEELFSYYEPLDYERSFPLSAWKNIQKEQKAMPNLNNQAGKEESLTLDDHSIQLNDSPESIEFLNAPIDEHDTTNELENDDQSDFVGEESQPSDTNHVLRTIRQMSPEEEKAMLEKQYFSLAKHAAENSQNLEERSNRFGFTFHPSVNRNINNSGKNHQCMERFEKNAFISSEERKRASEEQYVSLMNHAAKMYQQLKDS